MGIGKRIKEARKAINMTQEELANVLGITKSAIANYENETSHPKEPILYKMFDALNVDANYLFQDVVNLPKDKNDVTLAEYEHIKKYRNLDDHGRKIVDYILEEEQNRCDSDYMQTINSKDDADKYYETIKGLSKTPADEIVK